MEPTQSPLDIDRQNSIEWRLYRDMLVTRLFEEACIRWEHEGKMSAQVFPSRGQEAIAVGACLAMEKGDTVIPSFRTRGAMVAMGITIVEQLREIMHSPLAAGDSRDAPHHSSWPERGVMPGSTMIGGHLAMAAGLALAMQLEGQGAVSLAFFGDGTLGSGDLHETMHIAGIWSLPLILVCENNGWEMATPWEKVRKHRELIPYAEPFGFATRKVDGNDPWDVYHSARWARATALERPAGFSRLHHFSKRHLQFPFRRDPAGNRKRSGRMGQARSVKKNGRLVDRPWPRIGARLGASRGKRKNNESRKRSTRFWES